MRARALSAVWVGLGAVIALAACSANTGRTDGGGALDAGGPAYPYFCQCSCVRCLQYDVDAGTCEAMGRDPFPLAVCVPTGGDVQAACDEGCSHFGTDCMNKAGSQASDMGCM